MEEVIKGFKGFRKDMTAKRNNFQYEEGKEYETDTAYVCHAGFHACEHPLDCFRYYAPLESVFHEVQQSGEISRNNGDSKVASTKIKIGPSIDIAGMMKEAIKYTQKKMEENKKFEEMTRTLADQQSNEDYATVYREVSSATGVYGFSSATDYRGVSAATGYYGSSLATERRGVSATTGDCGVSVADGICGVSVATGERGSSLATERRGVSATTGDCGVSVADGICGVSVATGERGSSLATDYRGVSATTGYYGSSSATGNGGVSVATYCSGSSSAWGKNSIAVAWGYHGKARGVIGSYLVLGDWHGDENNCCIPRLLTLNGAKMVQVDGENIKENTWYTMKNGEIVEAEEE